MRVSRHTNLTAYLRAQNFNILSRGVLQAMVQRHARWSLVSSYLLWASTQLEYCRPRFIPQLLTWLSRVALQAMADAPHQYIACKIVSSQHKARGHHSMRYSQPLLRLGLVKLQGQRCRDVCCQIYRQVDRRKFGHAEQFQGCCASSVAKLLSIYWEQAFEYSKCVPLESSWYVMINACIVRESERGRETRTDTYRREISKHL